MRQTTEEKFGEEGQRAGERERWVEGESCILHSQHSILSTIIIFIMIFSISVQDGRGQIKREFSVIVLFAVRDRHVREPFTGRRTLSQELVVTSPVTIVEDQLSIAGRHQRDDMFWIAF